MQNENCPCKRTKCERYGKCDECRAHHRSMSGRKALTKCEKRKKKSERKAVREGKQ
ncbi:MAG: hypothetical protein ACI4XE_07390 [Acutalibacteraceae bacterium]